MTVEQTVYLSHPAAPKSLNAGGAGSRQHWSKGYAEKREWEQVWGVELMLAKVPRGATFCECWVVIEWRTLNRRDETNYIAPVVKPLADALVSAGVLPDDTGEFFKFRDLSFAFPESWSAGLSNAVTTVRLQLTYPTNPQVRSKHNAT